MSKARLRKKLAKVWKTFDDEWDNGKGAAKNARVYRMWDKSYDYIISVDVPALKKHAWCKGCAPTHRVTASFFRFNGNLDKTERLRNGVWS